MFQEKTIDDFTIVLGSKESVPGGGGAAALVGAVGISLGNMVGNFTLGKKKYADVEEDIKKLMVRAEDIRRKLLLMIDEDAKAFEPLSKAYSIPKDEPNREKVLEEALRNAAKGPMRILDLCCQAVEVISELGERGSKIILSDAASGAAILKAAIETSAVNVKVNTKLMKDKNYAEKLNKQVDEKLEKYGAMAYETYVKIYKDFF